MEDASARVSGRTGSSAGAGVNEIGAVTRAGEATGGLAGSTGATGAAGITLQQSASSSPHPEPGSGDDPAIPAQHGVHLATAQA